MVLANFGSRVSREVLGLTERKANPFSTIVRSSTAFETQVSLFKGGIAVK